MKLYVASSWRNPHQPDVVAALRAQGHDVYDFRHPPAGDHLGFSWSEVDPDWQDWSPEGYLRGIAQPIARAGFASDFGAMEWADACVLVLPCGRSAHLEAGYFVGARKPLVILLDEDEFRPGAGHSVAELMYRMADAVVTNVDAAIDALEHASDNMVHLLVTANVDVAEMATWPPGRIGSFFGGVAATKAALPGEPR